MAIAATTQTGSPHRWTPPADSAFLGNHCARATDPILSRPFRLVSYSSVTRRAELPELLVLAHTRSLSQNAHPVDATRTIPTIVTHVGVSRFFRTRFPSSNLERGYQCMQQRPGTIPYERGEAQPQPPRLVFLNPTCHISSNETTRAKIPLYSPIPL